MFIFIRCTPLVDGKFDIDRQTDRQRKRKKKCATEGERERTSEQGGGSAEMFRSYFSPLACIEQMTSRCPVRYIRSLCTEERREKAKEKEREKKKKNAEQGYAYTHTNCCTVYIGHLRPMAEMRTRREHHPVKR